MPHACIVAYAVTGPVKENPRRRSSRDRSLEAGVQEGMSAVLTWASLTGAPLTGPVLTGPVLTGAVLTGPVLTGAVLTGAVLTGAVLTGAVPADASWSGPGEASAYRQTSAVSPPGSACAAPALRIAASIFARLRTMPASPSSLATSAGPNADTAAMSNPQNAARKFSRLRRMVSQDRPDWNASRQSLSKIPWSSRTGRPHSSSW